MIKIKKQIMGLGFFIISAILYGAKYISAALSVTMGGQWSQEDFAISLKFTPVGLNFFCYVAFAIGLVYFIWGLYEENKSRQEEEK